MISNKKDKFSCCHPENIPNKCFLLISFLKLPFPCQKKTLWIIAIVWMVINVNLFDKMRTLISISDCNWTGTHNHLVHKRTLNHLAKLAFIYELNGCGFVPSCSHLNFRFRDCFQLGVPWHSGNYRVWIHSNTRTWHDKNIQSLISILLILPEIYPLSLPRFIQILTL